MPDNDDKKSARRPAEPKEESRRDDDLAVPEASGAGESLAGDARDVVRAGSQATAMGFQAMGATMVARAATDPVKATDSDITDELERGGPAFGSFVKSVGLAVAAAQSELDKTLVATAEALSKTKIDVIAVFEQQLNDETGEMKQGNVITQQLPLINYLMPTAYQWTRVYLQADMRVSEFNGANGFNIQGGSTSFGASARASYGLFGGLSVSGGTSFNTNRFDQSATSSYSQDNAAGSMHMEATLEPRGDVALPQPFIVQKGPQLKLAVGNSEPITTTTPPPASGGTATTTVTGRRVVMTAELRKTDGSVNNGKNLSVTVDRPGINFVTRQPGQTAANSATDANGQLEIEIRREGAAYDPATPLPIVVRVRFGLVSESVGLTL